MIPAAILFVGFLLGLVAREFRIDLRRTGRLSPLSSAARTMSQEAHKRQRMTVEARTEQLRRELVK
jgi:hypothetical protein